MPIFAAAKFAINRALARFDVELVSKSRHDWNDTANYIPFDGTIAAAAQARLSVGDYVDASVGILGATQATMGKVASLGVFCEPIKSVVEIGPGSGRYLEQTLKKCYPSRYEIYETAKRWAAYLAERYSVVVQPTDGRSLRHTGTGSIDLAHAHKVFSTIPFLATCRYWLEIARVVRTGGFAVFDVVTEPCMDPSALEIWASSTIDNGSFPALVPRMVVLDAFAAWGFSYLGSFFAPMPPGTTEVFVFRKRSD